MKRIMYLFLWILPVLSHAEDSNSSNSCNNSNPYSKQLCEKLAQSSEAIRQAREEAYKKELSKEETEISKRIAEEHRVENASSLTAQTAASSQTTDVVPAWQEALNTGKDASKQNTNTTPSVSHAAGADNDPVAISPIPNPGPTQFATPQTVTLPGGVKMIPVNPKKNSDSGSIKYY